MKLLRRAALRPALPLVAEAVGFLLGISVAGALVLLVVVAGRLEWILVVVPAAVGLANWARRWTRWRAAYESSRRRVLLADAIDRAPHRYGRTPAHCRYAPFVEPVGETVSIVLLRRSPGPHRGRAARTKVVEQRWFRGDDVGGAAGYLSSLEDRAAELEREERAKLDRARTEAERQQERRRAAAEEAQLREIDAAHAHQLAGREQELREAEASQRRRELELEAEALTRALRRG